MWTFFSGQFAEGQEGDINEVTSPLAEDAEKVS